MRKLGRALQVVGVAWVKAEKGELNWFSVGRLLG